MELVSTTHYHNCQTQGLTAPNYVSLEQSLVQTLRSAWAQQDLGHFLDTAKPHQELLKKAQKLESSKARGSLQLYFPFSRPGPEKKLVLDFSLSRKTDVELIFLLLFLVKKDSICPVFAD